MRYSHFVLPVLLLGLAACSTSTAEPAVYNNYPLCATDLKPDVTPTNIPGNPPSYSSGPGCVAMTPGSEMADRTRGQLGVPEGAAIIVTELFTGVTGIR